MPKHSSRLLLPAAVAFLTCCIRQDAVYTEYQDLPAGRWSNLHSLEFTPDSLTIASLRGKSAELSLHLRYNPQADVESLPVEVMLESYSTPAARDTVVFTLFRGNTPTGKGTYGVYSLSHSIHLPILPEGTRITLTPLSSSPTDGIQSVGIRIK